MLYSIKVADIYDDLESNWLWCLITKGIPVRMRYPGVVIGMYTVCVMSYVGNK